MKKLTDLIDNQTYEEIKKWLAKYPPEQKRSAVLPILLLIQKKNAGWLKEEILEAVADFLELPKISVYEVATFYNMYHLKPIGKHKLSVCTNISCMLSGSEKIVKHLKDRLGIGLGETTADAKFTLKEVECMGACVAAPMLQLNDEKYYLNLTPEKIDQLLEELK